jgi:TonB family protein
MDVLSRLTVAFLLNAVWQAAMVWGVAALADRWLRRAPARYRHALWVVTLAALVALPLMSTWRAADSPERSGLHPRVVITSGTQFVLVAAAKPRASRMTSMRVLLRRGLAGAHPGIPVPRPIARAIFLAYSAFLVLMLLRLGHAWMRTRKMRRDACLLPPGLLTTRGAEKGRLSAVILRCARLAGPVTVGAFAPAIIVPSSLLDPGAQEDLKAALAHEMAHVRRHDYLCNLMCELALVPVAFHPLARTIKRRLRETRELACDEMAADTLGPEPYARSLVRMAHQASEFAAPSALRPDYTLGVFDADILEERVMRLMKPRAGMRLAKCSFVCAALFIAASCVAAASFGMSAQSGQTGDGNQISSRPSPSAGTSGGVVGGVVGGVPGGVQKAVSAGTSGGVSGGTAGAGTADGVPAGVNGGVTVAGESGAFKYAGKSNPEQSSEQKTGTLSGIVVDTSGARIPKAEVRLISRNTSFQQAVESDDTGAFAFDDVPAGHYSLEVVSPGMGGAMRSFEFKADGEPPFFPFVLHPGDVTETAVVTVKGSADGNKAYAVGPRKIRIGGAVEAAKLVEGSQVPPEYPQAARDKGIGGLVVMEATISPEGTPTDLKVISSPDDSLSKAALDAVSRWKYQPTLLNGEPVGVITTITVNFQLQD